MDYAILILLGSILLGGAYVVLRVREGIRQISKLGFGTEDLMEGLRMQEEEEANTPKAAMGMTRLLLPRIERDFPEFHWPEWKVRCENLLTTYLKSLEESRLLPMEGCTDALKDAIRLEIEDRINREVKEKFENVKIHATELCDYKQESGLVKIRMITALQYMHSNDGQVKIENRKEQHRYYMELYYVQDITKAGDLGTVYSPICKHCGAPVKTLGMKYCEYCDSALEPVNLRVWMLGQIEKKD